jgi:hypothetical protein
MPLSHFASQLLLVAFSASAVFLITSCATTSKIADVRLNQIQVIGTHNSYHQLGHPSLRALTAKVAPNESGGLEYGHRPLPEQFDLGIRQIELDCFADPAGGLYAHPQGVDWAKAAGLPEVPSQDPNGELLRPGIKVMHVQDIDYMTSVLTLVDGLRQVRDWSARHPRHVPIFILLELKEDAPAPLLTKPLPFDEKQLDELESEILSVFTRDQIVTPDSVRGKETTLPEALRKHGWPRLDSVRGKVMFGLDNGGPLRDLYLKGHSALERRLIFVSVPVENPAAAWMKENDPVEGFDCIQGLVKAGFMVRTRSDADTIEARKNDTRRREKAFASGAQFISTDYPEPNPAFSDYSLHFEHNAVARMNPVSGRSPVAVMDLEPTK